MKPTDNQVAAVVAACKGEGTWQSPPLNMNRATVLGQKVVFCTNKKRDPIQRSHRNGTFYELEELSRLRSVVPRNAVFADFGANVGNHSLFFAIFMEASKVISVEPNPLAYELLVANTIANDLEGVISFDTLGIGVSDQNSGGFAMEVKVKNLGGAKMLAGEGDIQVVRGDEILKQVEPDFIKIDVEGMEMNVLRGLSGVLERCQPMIFIEVDDENAEAFAAWTKENGYASAYKLRRYRSNENHLLVAADKVDEIKSKLDA